MPPKQTRSAQGPDWRSRVHANRGKIAGFLAGTVGAVIFTLFVVVVLSGVPHGGERLRADRTVVYPNF